VKMLKLTCLVLLLIGSTGYGQKAAKPSTRTVTWTIDNVKAIGGKHVSVIGDPQVIKLPNGKAILFDGVDDGILVDTNPLAGAKAFTVEAVFRPDAGGNPEQRWFHIQETGSDDRILLETRLVGNEWFLDTFIKAGPNSRPLFAENFKHPLGPWYHVALVYDGMTMRHYVDGKEELSGALTIEPLTAGSTSMGVRMNRVFWFKGAIRKARFTPRALSPKEFMGKK
jgi:Concanavalin A-like lectin/glucanases superfamily